MHICIYRSRKNAQSKKYWLYKYKYLGSVLSTCIQHKANRVQLLTQYQEFNNRRTPGICWLARLVPSAMSEACLQTIRWKVTDKKTANLDLCPPHLHTCIHSHMQTDINTHTYNEHAHKCTTQQRAEQIYAANVDKYITKWTTQRQN